jgi:hypothetical protein
MNPEPKSHHGSAVVDGEIRYLSVSQLRTFSRCERRWFQSKVLRLPEPETKAQAIGTEVHAQVEHYLGTGEDVLGDVARELLRHLPAPNMRLDSLAYEGDAYDVFPRLMLEASLADWGLTADGIPLVGFIDIVNPRRMNEGILRLTDIKTTSAIGRYSADPEELVTTKSDVGIQMVGYAEGARVSGLFEGLREVEVEHLYTQTRGLRCALPVLGSMDLAHVESEWSRMHGVAKRMRGVAKAKALDEVEPNFDACDDYGGCPYRANCLTYQSSKENRTMGIMDRLKKASATVTEPPKVEATTATETPTPVVEVSTSVPEVAAVLPPDAPKSDPALAAEPLPSHGQESVQGQESPAISPTTESGGHDVPKKRGRPKKTETVIYADQATIDAAKTVIDQVATPTRLLFVDCVPNQATENLLVYVTKLADDLAKPEGSLDIRIPPHKDHPFAFNKWKGFLAAAIRANPPPPGAYVAFGVAGSELLQVAVEALEPMCALVVRGMR